jgi:hypothetical protein
MSSQKPMSGVLISLPPFEVNGVSPIYYLRAEIKVSLSLNYASLLNTLTEWILMTMTVRNERRVAL